MTLHFHQVGGPQMRVNSDPVFLRLPEVFQCDYFRYGYFSENGLTPFFCMTHKEFCCDTSYISLSSSLLGT